MAASSKHRTLLLSAWILVLAAGGAWFGAHMARRHSVEAPAILLDRGVPAFLLPSVAELPTVQLMGDAPYPVSLEDALGPHGTVVLFLDVECDPCREAARRWQQVIRAGEMGDVGVIAITASSRESIEAFRSSVDVEFPILRDPLDTYLTQYGVDSFPWQVVVDARRRVSSYTGRLSEMGSIDSLADRN